MKMLTAVILSALSAYPALAQNTPQQWSFVTTSESAPNAIPLSDSSGNPFPCTGQDPDNINDPNPNCYNPLIVTTDWTVASLLGVVTSATPATNFTLTNSNCTAQTFVTNTSISVVDLLGVVYRATFEVTLDNGATITFQGQLSLSSSHFAGTFTSTGACMNGDSGNFEAVLFPQVNATYSGQFETSSGGQGVSISLATDSSFSVTGTVTPAPDASTCFSNMTIATPLANVVSASFASGDVILAVASDNSGNVVAFIASNTDVNGDTLANDGLYITYVGVAGSCAGISETDAPFEKERSIRHHRRLRIRARDICLNDEARTATDDERNHFGVDCDFQGGGRRDGNASPHRR